LGDNRIYVSLDAGLTWIPTLAPGNQWECVAVARNGGQFVAADSGYGDGLIYISTNSGTSWTATGPPNYWNALAASADGSRLFAVAYPGGVYSLKPNPVLTASRSGTNLVLSWQDVYSQSGFVLRQAACLATNDWLTLTNLPALTNGVDVLFIPMASAGSHFYRLENP
jgi:hypothetical protein